MGVYVAVVFVDPLPAGHVFARQAWPLHATLLRFDAAGPADPVARALAAVAARHRPFTAGVGEDAGFGRDGSVPVSLVDAGSGLAALHADVLSALGPDIHVPGRRHTLGGYRPHVTHTVGRLHPGDALRVREVALVDMRPGGDPRFREVLGAWPLGGPG